MAFTLPVFNLLADLYVAAPVAPLVLPTAPPAIAACPCQVYRNPREQGQPPSYTLRLDKAFIDGFAFGFFPGSCAVINPFTSSAQLWLAAVDMGTVHCGFANEYYDMICYQCANDGATNLVHIPCG